jgi:hypothetical protein
VKLGEQLDVAGSRDRGREGGFCELDDAGDAGEPVRVDSGAFVVPGDVRRCARGRLIAA